MHVTFLLSLTLTGGLSVYHPGDGYSGSELSCGGTFNKDMHHIAIRQWRRRCSRVAIICSAVTLKCSKTSVRDSGPWGATDGKNWEVQVNLKPGWRRRAVVDMTIPVWRELGSPPAMSKVMVWIP